MSKKRRSKKNSMPKSALKVQKASVLSRSVFLSNLLTALKPAPSGRQEQLKPAMAIIFITGLLLVLLAPFVSSAFRIDDPLFLWAGHQIRAHPKNPYGFSVNWYRTPKLMFAVTKNPPLACYYIALSSLGLGWSEVALHSAFLLMSLAVGAGTFLLARRFCATPLLATLMAVLTPVFFVSSITVMSDMMMLAFWVFAIYLWITGVDSQDHLRLAIASILIAASALTKYFGMTLIPLLLAYTVVKQRRVSLPLLYFAIPTAILAWYQWITRHLYGRGLLLDAAAYASGFGSQFGRLSITKLLVALAFTGGCVASALFFARQVWSRKALLIGASIIVIVTIGATAAAKLGSFSMPADQGQRMLLAAQMGIWVATGLSILALAGMDLYERRDADSLLLFLWTVGTFIFAGFINWTTNGRSILPMIVPAGILMTRRLERRASAHRSRVRVPFVALAASMVLSLLVTWADCAFANSARTASLVIREKYPIENVSFQGHWGFQYYMEQLGMRALDIDHPQVVTGDLVVVPQTNTNLQRMPRDWSALCDTIIVPTNGVLATVSPQMGAGFYADVMGPLPFAAGFTPPGEFFIYDVTLKSK